jgi:hypothetical protein
MEIKHHNGNTTLKVPGVALDRDRSGAHWSMLSLILSRAEDLTDGINMAY